MAFLKQLDWEIGIKGKAGSLAVLLLAPSKRRSNISSGFGLG